MRLEQAGLQLPHAESITPQTGDLYDVISANADVRQSRGIADPTLTVSLLPN